MIGENLKGGRVLNLERPNWWFFMYICNHISIFKPGLPDFYLK